MFSKDCLYFKVIRVDTQMFSYNTDSGTLIRPAVILNGYSETAESSVTCFVHHSNPYVWVKYDYYGIQTEDLKAKLKNDWIILKNRDSK